MSGHAVRTTFAREFRGLSGHTRSVSAIIVGFYLLQLVFAISVGYWLLQYSISPEVVCGLAAVGFIIGTRLRGLNNIVHECSHFTFSQRREDNVFFGSLCASLVLSTYKGYREEHMTHHLHLGDYEKDLDLQGIQRLRLEEPLTLRTVGRHLLTALLGLHLPYYFSADLSARDGRMFQGLKVAIVAGALLFLVLDPVAALVLIIVPFVWIYSAINYWTDCVDHGGLVESEDELEASRNFVVPAAIRALLFPRNDCYHLVHHLFPQVPSHHLEACHQRLLAHPEYRARQGSIIGADGGVRSDAEVGRPEAWRPALAHGAGAS